MSFEYIRKHYNVPAKKGGRISYDGKFGTIINSRGAYLRIRLDGETRIGSYHPDWNIEYINADGRVMDKTTLKLICTWCDESPLEARYRSESGDAGYDYGWYIGCKNFMSNCPDTTGTCKTEEEAWKLAKEYVLEIRGTLADPRV